MKDIGSGIGVKNIPDLVLKEYMVFVKQKILQKNKLINIKWQKKKQIYKKFTNLSQEKLNTIDSKNYY